MSQFKDFEKFYNFVKNIDKLLILTFNRLNFPLLALAVWDLREIVLGSCKNIYEWYH